MQQTLRIRNSNNNPDIIVRDPNSSTEPYKSVHRHLHTDFYRHALLLETSESELLLGFLVVSYMLALFYGRCGVFPFTIYGKTAA